MPGHLFALRADLKRLACDALVIPCDSFGNVSRVWKDLIPGVDDSTMSAEWVSVPRLTLDDGVAHLTGHDGLPVTLVDTVGLGSTIDDLVARVVQAVRAAAEGASRHQGRHLPLVALPLVGTGQGGQAHRRGLVVSTLVPQLMALAAVHDVDIALVLKDRQDLAAVQSARAGEVRGREPGAGWEALDGRLLERADSLGELAAAGGLSLFLGSGVSAPLGLPSWKGLLEELACHSGSEFAPSRGSRSGRRRAPSGLGLQVSRHHGVEV